MSEACGCVALLFMRFLRPGATAEWRVLTSAETARWGKREGDIERDDERTVFGRNNLTEKTEARQAKRCMCITRHPLWSGPKASAQC